MRFPLHVAPLLPGVAHVRSFSLSLSLTLSVVHAGVNIFLFFFLAAGRRCPRAWDAHTRAGANFDRGGGFTKSTLCCVASTCTCFRARGRRVARCVCSFGAHEKKIRGKTS